MKKLLVCIVIALTLVPLLSTGSFAAAGAISPAPAFSDISGHPAEVALTVLGSLGVFTGGLGLGGAVDPDGVLTREAFCKVVVVAKGLSSQADALRNMMPPFIDGASISPWAWGYVNVATSLAIISGYVDGTFKGSQAVTYAEAIKMLVCAVSGHKAQTNPALGWPNQYIFYAVAHDFLDGVTPVAGLLCPRGDMARMLLATMLIDPLKADGTPDVGKAILHNLSPNANYWLGVFQGESGGSIDLSTWMGPIPLASLVYVLGASTYAELVGTDVECVAKSDGKIVFIRRVAGTSNVGTFVELAIDAGGTYITLKEGLKYYYSAPIAVTINQVSGYNESTLKPGDWCVVNTDGSGQATAVNSTRYDLVYASIAAPPFLIPAPEDALSVVTASSGVIPTRVTFPAGSPYGYYDRNTATYKAIHSVQLDIGAGASIKINGLVATPNDLQPGDVVKAATLGAKGYLDATSIIAVIATRQVVDGTVVTNAARYSVSGTTYWVTINEGGVNHEYQRYYASIPLGNCYLNADLIPGQHYRLAKNLGGQLYYSIGFTTANPIVFVKGVIVTSGPPITYEIVVDNMGVEQVLACGTYNPGLALNHFAQLTIDGATGLVTSIGLGPLDPSIPCSVASATASNVTLQSVPPGAAYFATSPPCVVYRQTSPGVYTYIGTAGLSAGWLVSAHNDGGGNPLVIVYTP